MRRRRSRGQRGGRAVVVEEVEEQEEGEEEVEEQEDERRKAGRWEVSPRTVVVVAVPSRMGAVVVVACRTDLSDHDLGARRC